MDAPKPHKLLELEGLRGLAALCVVVGHIQATFFAADFARYLGAVATLPMPFGTLIECLSKACFNGRFAVWVFWTLSGFALSYRFFVLRGGATGSQSRFYLLDAAVRRYPRLLLPVLAATLFGFALLKCGLMANQAVVHSLAMAGHPNSWLAGLYNAPAGWFDAVRSAFWSTFFSSHVLPYYDPPLWTMKRELLGSFFIFGLLAFFGTSRWRWLLYLAGGLVFIRVHQIWLDAFLAGIVLCDLYVSGGNHAPSEARPPVPWIAASRRNPAVAVVGAIFLLVLIGYFGRQTALGIDVNPQADFSYIFLAFLTLFWVQFSFPVRAILSNRFWAFMGKISFGIYISHLPFIMSASCRSYLWATPKLGHLAAAWGTAAWTVPAVIGLGFVFYRIADRPSLPFSKLVAASVLRLGALLKPGWLTPAATLPPVGATELQVISAENV
jgi:peptidoglycan/LPS O-acetylase OafA/YrhL